MFVAAGEVIENAAGVPWEEYLHTTILQPLGMNNTVLSVRELSGRTNVATPHGEEAGKVRAYPWYEWDNVAPAGGIISCVADLARWMRLHLNRGRRDSVQIWTEAQSRMMWTPHANFIVGGTSLRSSYMNFSGYGLGWSLYDYHGHMVADHGGGYDGMYSQTVLVPDLKLGVVVLTNSMTSIANAATMQVVNAYLGVQNDDRLTKDVQRERESKERQRNRRLSDDSTRVLGTKPSRPLASYCGTYGGPLYGDAAVTLENGKLVLRLLPNPDLVGDLSYWHYDVFEVTWRKSFPWFGKGKVQFVMNEQASVNEMKINVPNNDFWFDELEFKRAK